jgi:hypothetical protein
MIYFKITFKYSEHLKVFKSAVLCQINHIKISNSNAEDIKTFV